MKIRIHRDISDREERGVISDVFRVCERELKLVGNDATLLLAKDELPEGVLGETHTVIRPGRGILMVVWRGFEIRRTHDLEVFCHEMVHVGQTASGELRASKDGVTWRGQFIPKVEALRMKDKLSYARLYRGTDDDNDIVPWEGEAYRRGRELRDIVMKELV